MVYTFPKLAKIEINNIDVSAYIYDGRFTKSKQPVKTGNFKFNRNISNVLTIQDSLIGKSFTIQRGFSSATERYVFRGEVTSFKLVGSIYEFTVADRMYGAVKLEYIIALTKILILKPELAVK
jgi:hypothetical protein